jgi:tRNA dimethylallyltransferase
VRARLAAAAEAEGWPALHRRLAAVDPGAAARINPNDPQRIQRALEVYELTGQPLSRFHGAGRVPGPPAVRLAVAFAGRERQRAAIAERFHAMLAEGFLDEVDRLYRRGDLHPGLPAMRLVGYRQAWAHLAGELDRAEMTRKAIVATQQLGKRQLTWLRGEKDLAWFDASDAGLDDKILKFLQRDATLKWTV